MAIIDGSNGNDNLVGTASMDMLKGLAGDDRLTGRAGADVLDGGDGTDTADYATSKQRVSVSLFENLGLGGDAAGDSYISIENLTGSAFDDGVEGDGGNNLLRGGKGADQLFGRDGFDTADYATAQQTVKVSLFTGTGFGREAFGHLYFSIENVTGSAFNDELEGDNGINVLSGGKGADTLFGGAGADTLKGGEGNDRIAGGAGADVLDGGAGNDVLDYSASAGAVRVDLRGVLNFFGDAAGDTLIEIENLIGSASSDGLTGNDAANALSGGAGNDVIVGGAGADLLDGDSGIDTADYSASAGAIRVDLRGVLNFFGDAAGDTLVEIENLIGSASSDGLTGNDAANALSGGAGNDEILGNGGNDVIAGGTGADLLDGDNGIDTAHYSASAEGVTVSLFGGFGQGGDAEGDSILEIENLIGSAHGDLLGGSAVANSLKGGAGGDELFGALGRDELTGGAGADFFFYGNTTDSGVTAATRDLIRDFNRGQKDKLVFELEDAQGLDLAFKGQDGFTAAGQVRFFSEGDHTVVAVKTVGSSGAEMQIELAGHINLVASDFAFGG